MEKKKFILLSLPLSDSLIFSGGDISKDFTSTTRHCSQSRRRREIDLPVRLKHKD
ncbi:unnamed protein product [Arabidopsis lyrata]|uniref:Predicted protein n=1 Tax=Arabidopsis lyrata subsp. lyrata TaxID=81972 RepID=D7KPJ2_ARALL|nr:predicted protein [Arabidopsis lyrata subsp. lyrata]CAH8253418.1 unnamed protein product [Arabidopsis lyrata]